MAARDDPRSCTAIKAVPESIAVSDRYTSFVGVFLGVSCHYSRSFKDTLFGNIGPPEHASSVDSCYCFDRSIDAHVRVADRCMLLARECFAPSYVRQNHISSCTLVLESRSPGAGNALGSHTVMKRETTPERKMRPVLTSCIAEVAPGNTLPSLSSRTLSTA